MIQPVTVLGAAVFLGALFLKYRRQPSGMPRRGKRPRMTILKIVLAAAVAWLALTYTLQHMLNRIGGS